MVYGGLELRGLELRWRQVLAHLLHVEGVLA